MKPTIQVHHSRATTHLPTRERLARHRRSAANLPLTPRPSSPCTPAACSRKTADTRWSTALRFGSTLL